MTKLIRIISRYEGIYIRKGEIFEVSYENWFDKYQYDIYINTQHKMVSKWRFIILGEYREQRINKILEND